MKVINHTLRWEESFDDDDNSIWEASGPYGDEEGGCLGSWRLRQKLSNNQLWWYSDHDPELQDEEDSWTSLEKAKTDIEALHQYILDTYEK